MLNPIVILRYVLRQSSRYIASCASPPTNFCALPYKLRDRSINPEAERHAARDGNRLRFCALCQFRARHPPFSLYIPAAILFEDGLCLEYIQERLAQARSPRTDARMPLAASAAVQPKKVIVEDGRFRIDLTPNLRSIGMMNSAGLQKGQQPGKPTACIERGTTTTMLTGPRAIT